MLFKRRYLPANDVYAGRNTRDDRIDGSAPEKISVRTSYNISAISFSPAEIAACIRQHIPQFEMHYKPDYRQAIAHSWPQSIDDAVARKDWNWQPEYDLEKLTADMLKNLKPA
jgi:nucleoside-diphosphate-sugar epimerase